MITEAPPRPPVPPAAPAPAPGPKPPGIGRPLKALIVGPLILALVAMGMYVAIRAAYGGFADVYQVKMTLPRAGQLLQTGSDVRLRGVRIGEVSDIELVGREVQLTLQIDSAYRIPAGVEAMVSLKTLLGAKFIELRTDRFQAPFLKDGQTIRQTHVGPELEDALADGVQVFEAIRPNDLAIVIHELATGARDHGEDVARGLAANSDLSDLFASTLDPQIQALHDFKVIFGALEDKGVDLVNLADAINEGVPVYASQSAQKDLDRALEAIVPFADNLGDLVILNREDWDRLIENGDIVLGSIAVRAEDLRDLVTGLFIYVEKLSADPVPLPNGSAQAPFANFMGGTDPDESRNQFCDGLPPEVRENAPLCTGGGVPQP